MDLRQPCSLEFARVTNRSIVVSVKIPAADRVPVIEVIVHFADRVVRADAVGKAEVDRGGSGRVGAKIRGESRAIAGNRRAQRAATDLQAGRAYRFSAHD